MKRVVVVGSSLLLLAMPVGAEARSSAAKGPKPVTIDVQTHYTEPGSQIGGLSCHGLEAPSPDVDTCRGHAVGPVTFTGTMYGDAWYDIPGWAGTDGKLYYEGSNFVNGGIEGCGTGSYIIDDYDGYIDMTKYDPLTNSAPGFNRWRIRPGGGTGDLKSVVSGEGVNHWRAYFGWYAGMAEHFGEGDFTGTITCLR